MHKNRGVIIYSLLDIVLETFLRKSSTTLLSFSGPLLALVLGRRARRDVLVADIRVSGHIVLVLGCRSGESGSEPERYLLLSSRMPMGILLSGAMPFNWTIFS